MLKERYGKATRAFKSRILSTDGNHLVAFAGSFKKEWISLNFSFKNRAPTIEAIDWTERVWGVPNLSESKFAFLEDRCPLNHFPRGKLLQTITRARKTLLTDDWRANFRWITRRDSLESFSSWVNLDLKKQIFMIKFYTE